MLASHWIPKKLLKSMDNLKTLESLAKKFLQHYKDDEELVNVCNEIKKYVKKPTNKKRKEIEMKLKKLIGVRKIGGSGGTGLWYKDVRVLSDKEKVR